MKKISILFILVIFCFFNNNVLAEEDPLACTSEELASLKKIAKRVEVNYEYEFNEENKNGEIIKYPVFSLVATNLNRNIRALIINDYSKGDYREFKNGIETTASLTGFNEGERIVVVIKSFTLDKCTDKTLSSITIKLPYYNSLSDSIDCLGYPDFKYCAKFLERTINKELFESELLEYIASLEEQESVIENNGNWTLLIIIGIIIGVLLIAAIITSIIMKIRKKNDL